jgi:8-oxo-dGTP pyrophosphatase MutT (NUDIX family)
MCCEKVGARVIALVVLLVVTSFQNMIGFCFCREIQEECGLVAENLQQVGILMFKFVDSEQLLEVHVFRSEEFSGILTESQGN